MCSVCILLHLLGAYDNTEFPMRKVFDQFGIFRCSAPEDLKMHHVHVHDALLYELNY